MVQPVEINHICLPYQELASQLLINVVLKFLMALSENWGLKWFVLNIFLFFFQKCSNIVDGVTLQSMILIELEIIEFIECSLCF